MLVAGVLGATAQLPTTGDSLYFLYPVDTMTVEPYRGSDQLIFQHHLAPSQTVYGAAKFYGVHVEDLFYLEPMLRTGYQVGDVVRVPISPGQLRRTLPVDSLAWFVPVRYKLQAGETLFGLATRRLGWLNDAPLRTLNPDLDAQRLSPGTTLHIGYLSVAGLPPSDDSKLDPLIARNRNLSRIWGDRTAGRKMKSENGKAAWTKRGGKNSFMVLHRTAPVNSIIELTDPRSRKTIYARVVGPIPEQTYDLDVIVVVSPLIVKAFGARDSKFYVRTRHF